MTSRAAAWTLAMLPWPPHWATSRPPWRRCARRRAKSASWSAIQWKVAVERIASACEAEVEGRRGRPRAARRGRPGARARRRSSRPTASTPITRPPGRRSSSASVTRPEPQPASMTVSSPVSGRRSSTSRPIASMGAGEPVVLGAAPGAGLAHFSPRPTRRAKKRTIRSHSTESTSRMPWTGLAACGWAAGRGGGGAARRGLRRGRLRGRAAGRRDGGVGLRAGRLDGAPRRARAARPPAPARRPASPAGTARSRASSAWRCPRSSRRARSAPGGR